MFLMVEKSIGGGILHATYRYVKTNYKYMKNYEKKKKEPTHLKYCGVNNLYG